MSGYINVSEETGNIDILPVDFYGGSAVVYDNKIHILGGGYYPDIYYYWTGSRWIDNFLPYNFLYGSAVVYDNKIHILGGIYEKTSHYSYDGTSWTEESSLPYDFSYGSAVVYDNKIHILGGAEFGTDGRTIHYSWDGTNWRQETNLPYQFERGSAVVYDNKIHILGGASDSDFDRNHYSWDGTSWISESTLPYRFSQGSSVVYLNNIYLLGGFNDKVGFYSWNGDSWLSEGTLSYQFRWGSAISYGNKIHLLGGYEEYTKDNHYVWYGTIWEPAEKVILDSKKIKNGWIEVPDKSKIIKIIREDAIQAPTECYYHPKAVLYNDKIHVLSNRPNILYHYSYDGKQWIKEESIIPFTPNNNGVVYITYDDKIHMIGSIDSNIFGNGRKHLVWDGSSWDDLGTIQFTTDYLSNAAVVYNNKIYLIGTFNEIEYLYSYDGTNWSTEPTSLPHNNSKYANVVVYDGKIHIMGDATDNDSHYAWDGSSWITYPNMPFNAIDDGPVYVDEYSAVPCINVLAGNKHYMWYKGGWWIDDGNSISTLPYTFDWTNAPTAIQYNNIIHLIGNSSENTTNHYLYNWKDNSWQTSIEIKEDVQPGRVSIYDNLIFDKMLRRVRKAWIGDLNGEPKLALKSVPSIDDLSSLGCTIPNNMVVGNFNSYRMAAVSFNDRIHVLGGAYDVHYSFAVSYDNSGNPIAIDLKKETPLPYSFQANTVVVLYGRIHIFGSGATIDYRLKHYSYGTDGEWIDECGTSRGPVISNKSIMVQVDTDVYFFLENMITKYTGSTNTWTSVQSTAIPFWIDNTVYGGWEAGIYDDINNRIIISYYNNGSTYFYAVDLSYSNLVEMATYGISLIRTVNNAHFLHPLYVDVDVLPNGEDGFLYVFGDQDITSRDPIYKYYDNEWHSIYNLPYPFYDGCAIMYDDMVHILGGSASANRTKHYMWDGSDNWFQEQNLPYNFYRGAVVIYDNKMHILGSGDSNYYTSHYSWDGINWTQESTLPYDFNNGCAVVYKNKIHILGGTTTDPYTSINGGTTYHYAWDGTSWSQVSTLPYNFDSGSAVVYNGKIHILGGYDSGNEGLKHYAWNGSGWVQISTLPYNFMSGTACVYMDRIHIMGGMNKSDYTSYSYHYYLHGTVWRSQEDMPYAMDGISSIVVNVPSQKYMIGWTNRNNYDLSYTGLGAFSLSEDPNLSNCIACSWNGITNNYMPAITLTHNYRIFMIDVDGNGGYDGVEPSIYELKMARMNDYFITFNEYDDNVLGKLNVNNLVYNNDDLYTYGGGRDFSFYSGGTNSVYLYKYESARSKGKWAKVNTTYHNDINPMGFGLDGGNENIGLIHEGKIVIFTNATAYNDHNNTIYTRSFIMRLIINPSNGSINQLPFASTNSVDINSIANEKLYGLDFNRCYGLFSYNGLIYFLGGAYTPNTNGAYMKITKYNPIKRTLEYVGRIWDTPSNSMVTRNILLPYTDRYPYRIDKFGYGVIGTDLHIVYVQNGTTYHKILDLVTEANYYQFDNKKELPLSEPLRDATAPPSTFCGPCFTYDDYLFAVCKETVGSTIAYKIYYLVEYTEHYVNEDVGLDNYYYACRWDIMFMTYNPNTLRYIMANRYNKYYDPTIEFIYDTDGVASQVEGTIEESFE